MKGYSLHIGLNYVDPNHYGGWDGKLTSCENDAYDMQAIVESLNYSTKTLIREQATRKNVINAITEYSKQLEKGDILYISYSAHGGQIVDQNSEEEDALDETWCLFDGQLIDDELYYLWSLFKSGVRIFVTSDSCNSGTILKEFYASHDTNTQQITYSSKNTPVEIASRTYYNNKAFYDKILNNLVPEKDTIIKASVILLSGCQDYQSSYDGPFNGVFTKYLKIIWNGGKFKGNYSQFHKKITALAIKEKPQTPNLLIIGKPNSTFKNQIPFQIK